MFKIYTEKQLKVKYLSQIGNICDKRNIHIYEYDRKQDLIEKIMRHQQELVSTEFSLFFCNFYLIPTFSSSFF